MSAGPLLTVDEYLHLEPRDHPTELVRGRIVELQFSYFHHSWLCAETGARLLRWAHERAAGWVVFNTGIITQRSPDTVRGADVAFYSFAKLPAGEFPAGYAAPPPDVVFEVRSPHDLLSSILEKVAEYLQAQVPVVVVIDPQRQTALIFREAHEEHLVGNAILTLPDELPGFQLALAELWNPPAGLPADSQG